MNGGQDRGFGAQHVFLSEQGVNAGKQAFGPSIQHSKIPRLKTGSILYIAGCNGRKAREEKSIQLFALQQGAESTRV